MYNIYSDDELAALMQEGDEKAFNTLYHRFHKDIYAYALTLLKNTVWAEDLVHEVFIRIWEKRTSIRIETSFSSYLFRVCHNKAVDFLKKIASDNELRKRISTHLQPALTFEAADRSTARFYDELLEEALNILPPQRRKVFELCRQEGKTYDETASALGLSRSTVKDHMVKALRSLREFLYTKGELANIIIAVLLYKLPLI